VIRLGGLVVALGLAVSAAPAAAITDSLSTTGPMAFVNTGGLTRIYALTTAGSVVRRLSSTSTWSRVTNPSGVTFTLNSGVASAIPPGGWGYPRVFAVRGGASPAL